MTEDVVKIFHTIHVGKEKKEKTVPTLRDQQHHIDTALVQSFFIGLKNPAS